MNTKAPEPKSQRGASRLSPASRATTENSHKSSICSMSMLQYQPTAMPATRGTASLKRGYFFRKDVMTTAYARLQGTQSRNDCVRVGILEHRVTGYKGIGTCSGKQLAGLHVHAAVNLNESL